MWGNAFVIGVLVQLHSKSRVRKDSEMSQIYVDLVGIICPNWSSRGGRQMHERWPTATRCVTTGGGERIILECTSRIDLVNTGRIGIYSTVKLPFDHVLLLLIVSYRL